MDALNVERITLLLLLLLISLMMAKVDTKQLTSNGFFSRSTTPINYTKMVSVRMAIMRVSVRGCLCLCICLCLCVYVHVHVHVHTSLWLLLLSCSCRCSALKLVHFQTRLSIFCLRKHTDKHIERTFEALDSKSVVIVSLKFGHSLKRVQATDQRRSSRE